MAIGSNIEWTEATWNPTTGCTRVSPGCKNCYADRMAQRLELMGSPNYANGFRLTTHEHMLHRPLRWKKSRVVFTNSMSDLFHEKVPRAFILRAFDVMRQAHWHTFQVLTKRSQRLVRLATDIAWTSNVWMGVSVESEKYIGRIDDLRNTPARTRFLSLEPLLGALPDLNLRHIDWVIVGGESGPHARPMNPSWVRDIRDQCVKAEVPFFFKQWGGVNKKKTGRVLDGRSWDEMPDASRLELVG